MLNSTAYSSALTLHGGFPESSSSSHKSPSHCLIPVISVYTHTLEVLPMPAACCDRVHEQIVVNQHMDKSTPSFDIPKGKCSQETFNGFTFHLGTRKQEGRNVGPHKPTVIGNSRILSPHSPAIPNSLTHSLTPSHPPQTPISDTALQQYNTNLKLSRLQLVQGVDSNRKHILNMKLLFFGYGTGFTI